MNSDAAIAPSIPALAGANAAARVGDIPMYLCPSDPSTMTQTNAGRSNYMVSTGANADYRGGLPGDGIFAMPNLNQRTGIERTNSCFDNAMEQATPLCSLKS